MAFHPSRDIVLESKAWINYPQLLQEHSFKGYISDHNLWGLCFLHLLSDFTNTNTQGERVRKEYAHMWVVKTFSFYILAFDIINVIRSGGLIWLINHTDETALISEDEELKLVHYFVNLTHLHRRKRRKQGTRRCCDAEALLKPNNETCLREDSVTPQIQKHGEKGCLLLSGMDMWSYSKKKTLNTTKCQKRHEWGLCSETSNCDALVSKENKWGWEKWASRCDSLFLRPPWHHLQTAGMCSIIFINIGSSHSWQI